MPKYMKDEVDEENTILDMNEESTESFDDKCNNNEEVVKKTKFEVKEEISHDVKDDETIEDARDKVVLRNEYVFKPEDKNTKIKIEEKEIEVIGKKLDKSAVLDVEECEDNHVNARPIDEETKKNLDEKEVEGSP